MAKTKQATNKKIVSILAAALIITALLFLLLHNSNFAVLNPKGSIATQQRTLIINAFMLMLIVVIPVFIMTFYIAFKYREGNKHANYSPNWDNNRLAETTWWLIPLVIIVALSVIIWKSSHRLDPYQALVSNTEPVKVQVIALDWKWLFIYPEQGVATVNYLPIPTNTPIDFEITSDAPMNSFWIPQLGGQVYAMAGMQTQLHLNAEKAGDYQGSSANISGDGFAGMRFNAHATSKEDFNKWVDALKKSNNKLDYTKYQELAKASKNNPPAYYAISDNNIFDKVLMKYMMPDNSHSGEMNMDNMEVHHH